MSAHRKRVSDVLEAFSPDALASVSTIADPYPVYRALWTMSPVRFAYAPALHDGSQPHAFALLRHREVLAAARDVETFSGATPELLQAGDRLGRVRSVPPRRTHLWSLVSEICSAARISALSEPLYQIAEELLAAAGPGPTEFMTAYAIPLSARMMVELLGLPARDVPLLQPWLEAAIASTGAPSVERPRRIEGLKAYLDQVIDTRRAEPANDGLSTLMAAEIEGQPLLEDEIRFIISGIMVASSQSTKNLLGNMMALLADRPELWRRAREDRSLVDLIIEETLRYESPMQHFRRVTTRAVEVSGVEIPEGALVELSCGAANRDPEVFEAPDTFWSERPTNREHLGFGRGLRYCAGAPLVRLAARITLDAFLDRFSALGRGSMKPERQRTARVALGYTSLPLVLGQSAEHSRRKHSSREDSQ